MRAGNANWLECEIDREAELCGPGLIPAVYPLGLSSLGFAAGVFEDSDRT